MPVTDRWAVLTPEGVVISDEYSNLFGEVPLSLKDWIKSEIEWLESDSYRESESDLEHEYPTVCAIDRH